MNAIFKRELKSRFRDWSGWILTAIQLLIGAAAIFYYVIYSGNTDFSYLFKAYPIVYVAVIPILTVKSFVKDGKSGMTQYLFSRPVKPIEILLGKYFAMLTVLCIPLAVLALVPLILSVKVEIDLLTNFLFFFACVLYAAALLAFSCAVSSAYSKAKRPILVTLLSMLPLLALWYLINYLFVFEIHPLFSLILVAVIALLVSIPLGIVKKKWWLIPAVTLGAAALAGTFYLIDSSLLVIELPDLLLKLTPTDSLGSLLSGDWDLTAMAILLSWAVFFLAIAFKNINRDRTKRKKRLMLPAVTAALLAVNLLLSVLPFGVRHLDLTKSDFMTVSASAKEALREVGEPVTIYYLSEDGSADTDLVRFLLSLTSQSESVRFKTLDLRRGESVGNYTAEELAEHSGAILVASEKRTRMINSSDLYYYSSSSGSSYSPKQYSLIYQAYLNATDEDTMESYYQELSSVTSVFCGESVVANAVFYVTQATAPTVSNFVGEGGYEYDFLFAALAKESGYDYSVETDFSEAVKADVILLNTYGDLSEENAALLGSYLAAGGKLLLSTSYGDKNTPNLNAVLETYGMTAYTGLDVVYEYDENYLPSSSYPYVFFAAQANSEHEITKADSFDVLFYAAHALYFEDVTGVTHYPLLASSNSAKDIINYSVASNASSQILSLAAEAGDTRIVWVSAQFDNNVDTLSSGGNFRFLLRSLNWLSGETHQTAVAKTAKEISSTSAEISTGAVTAFFILGVLGLPGVTIGIGAIVRFKRKKRLK